MRQVLQRVNSSCWHVTLYENDRFFLRNIVSFRSHFVKETYHLKEPTLYHTKSRYSLLHLECLSISISNLYRSCLFSTGRGKRDFAHQIIDWDDKMGKMTQWMQWWGRKWALESQRVTREHSYSVVTTTTHHHHNTLNTDKFECSVVTDTSDCHSCVWVVSIQCAVVTTAHCRHHHSTLNIVVSTTT